LARSGGFDFSSHPGGPSAVPSPAEAGEALKRPPFAVGPEFEGGSRR
jgi:hypothetical protein